MNRFIESIIILFLCVGCSKTNFDLNKDMQQTKKISFVPLSKNVCLTIPLHILKNKGTFLQEIETKKDDVSQLFSVHLNLDKNFLKATAFHDIQGPLYDMTFDADELKWNNISLLTKNLNPEYILGDFLLTHASYDDLKTNLKGADFYEINLKNKRIRLILKDNMLIRRITSMNKKGIIWQSVIIENLEYKYVLNINTVKA